MKKNSVKKKLLVNWGYHTFFNFVPSILIKLRDDFDTIVIISSIQDEQGQSHIDFINKLNHAKKVYGIIDYFIVNCMEGSRSIIKSMLNISNKLKNYQFDVWIASSDVQLVERFVHKFFLSEACQKYVLSPGVTYINMIRGDGTTASELYNFSPKKWDIIRFFKAVKTRFNRVVSILKIIYDRLVTPFIYCGTTFVLTKNDKITQLSDLRVDKILLVDPSEVIAHRKFYKSDSVCLVSHPNVGSCRCKGDIDKDIILSPLSGILGYDTVPDKILQAYYRDFSIVLHESKAKKIHIRPHPRETGNWPADLCSKLCQMGIQSELISAEDNLQDIVCNYLGVAGFASCSLRDARAICDYIFVVSFELVSCIRYHNPKIVFGESEGISWVNGDGSYDAEIFETVKISRESRLSISDFIAKDTNYRKKLYYES